MPVLPSSWRRVCGCGFVLSLAFLGTAPTMAADVPCTEAWLAHDDIAGTRVPLVNGDFETAWLHGWDAARGEGDRPPRIGHDHGSNTHVAVLAAEDARIEQSVEAPDATSASTGTDACYVLRFRTRGVGPFPARLRYELAGVWRDEEPAGWAEFKDRFLAVGQVGTTFGWTEHTVLIPLLPMEHATALWLRLQRTDDHDSLTNLYVDDVALTRLQREKAPAED